MFELLVKILDLAYMLKTKTTQFQLVYRNIVKFGSRSRFEEYNQTSSIYFNHTNLQEKISEKKVKILFTG